MTLSQLRAFALVARLGSMRAAAAALGISEPAVSSAVAALRHSFDDPLVVRSGGGIALTAGGRRLAAHADEIVGLADRARREVAAAGSAPDVLRVVATPGCAEHAAPALVDTFTRRSPGTLVELVPERAGRLSACLAERSADIVLGQRPATVEHIALDVVPFLRYRRVVVVGPTHRMGRSAAAGGGVIPAAQLAAERWFSGVANTEPLTAEGRWFARLFPGLEPVGVGSEADALAAVRAGEGVMLALNHVVRGDVRRGELVVLAVAGTPVQGYWCASTLGQRRSSPEARALQRFATTPDATAAMTSFAAAGSARQARPMPPVHVTLWS